MEKAADYCVNEISRLEKRPVFIGITGDSGSGKSYLTKLILDRMKNKNLNCTSINNDEFLISRADREPMKSIYYNDGKFKGKSHWEILENMFRLDEYQQVIDSIKMGSVASFYPYSRETGGLSLVLREIVPADFIIFDTSVMLQRMDYIIMVDVTQENIIKRKLLRDKDIRTSDQIIEMHTKVQGYYWNDRGRPDKPNIIIDNNDFDNVRIIKLR